VSNRMRSLQATIAIAKARQEILKKYGLDSVGENTLISEMEKMVEDQKAIETVKANQPQIIQLPTRKSWQDNIWLFLIIGIVIGAGGFILGQTILNALPH
jgi:hypothetical protein